LSRVRDIVTTGADDAGNGAAQPPQNREVSGLDAPQRGQGMFIDSTSEDLAE
jgi:hypothetical protein